jgi:hypothetical protein
MSTPMTALEIRHQLDKWDVPYTGYKNWATHNRGNRGNGFSNVKGLMVHHTGSDSTDQREYLHTGNSDLPGPLCHFGLDQKGRIHLIGWGRTNHAGGGDPDVLSQVVHEEYSGMLHPKYHEGSAHAADGNGYFYGVEIWYSGSHEMTDAQYFTLTRLAAAICDFHNWSELSVIGHGEWSSWKWDPGISTGKIMNMVSLRNDLSKTIERGPNNMSGPSSKPTAFREVWETDAAKAPEGMETPDNLYWQPISILRGIYNIAKMALKNTEDIKKHLGI